MTPVTTLITVGPKPCYKAWLPEAVQSVLEQTILPSEILLIDDRADIDYNSFAEIGFRRSDDTHKGMCRLLSFDHDDKPVTLRLWQPPWHLWFPAAFNCGVGLAQNDLVLFLAADDKLFPHAVEDCVRAYQTHDNSPAWYQMTYQTQGGYVADLPNNAAMIHRDLWKWLGGFLPSGFAGPDAMLISILLTYAPDKIIKVNPDRVHLWLREHDQQETGYWAGHFHSEVISIRDKETKRFIPNPDWTKSL